MAGELRAIKNALKANGYVLLAFPKTLSLYQLDIAKNSFFFNKEYIESQIKLADLKILSIKEKLGGLYQFNIIVLQHE